MPHVIVIDRLVHVYNLSLYISQVITSANSLQIILSLSRGLHRYFRFPLAKRVKPPPQLVFVQLRSGSTRAIGQLRLILCTLDNPPKWTNTTTARSLDEFMNHLMGKLFYYTTKKNGQHICSTHICFLRKYFAINIFYCFPDDWSSWEIVF